MRKKLIILSAIIVAAIISYNYIYQDHRDIESESAEFVISTAEISNQFSEDALASEQKYLNKTIEVSGTISELNTNEITIDDKVFCQFSNPILNSINVNSKIKVKGRVIGYDDLLEQIKLDQCTIIK
ncbi:hypothetical protein H8K90_04345 [Winogradskyella echinorum]|uniref:tRNA_anti-like n=1 Tax=Winogradskyella echinorum TaxID=538189 RepID=A0ABR6XYN5_9FLAO|nr:hypothetical protein [Winogradskyella echinorum]MBC3845596.1 hypothetical protein [Winogradskyella echinorum]MBC5749944.1 hypothetical protein [Winogradskyella echinorum]